MSRISIILLLLLTPLGARAEIVVDGTYVGDETEYGPARSVQNTNTGYGNSTNGDSRYANSGSEIDQVFARVSGGRLFVLLAGNLESNFNKLNVFIDSVPGGMNQIVGANAPSLVDPYCCGGSVGALQQLNNFRFDPDFAADHFLTFSNGNHTFGSGINIWTLSAYYADLTQGPGGNKSEIGFQRNAHGFEPGFGPGVPIDQINNGCTGPSDTNCMPPEHEFAEPVDTVNDPTNSRGHRDFLNDIDLMMAINNSNTQGVNAGTSAATGNPASVLTGIEFSIPLSVIGNPTDEIKIVAYIGSGGHNNVSNQFAGVGVLRNNLGSPGSVNLANIEGDQFVTVPVPSGDFDNDGDVDGRDFLVWQRNPSVGDVADWHAQYGRTQLQAMVIPEPTSATLFVALWIVVLRRLK